MMKKAATLIITGLIAVSLMGQTVKKSIPEYKKLKKHNKIEAFESRKSKRPEHKCFIKHRFTTQQTARLKSTLAVKQGLDSILCEFYNESTSQWVADVQEEYSYDAAGNLTESLFCNWEESTSLWVACWKEEYSYDAAGNLTESLAYDWEESTSLWVACWKEEYSYDATGNLTESLVYDWEESTSLWVADWKDEYSYDATGNLTEILSYYWNESTSQWVACWKDEYSYDAAGNLTEYLSYDWNESISQWVVDWKQEYTYNNSYSFDELLLPYYDDFFILHFRHMLTESILYYWDDFVNQWILDYKGTFFYSEKNINNISDLSVMDIKIYPNPATEFVVFDVNSTSKTAIVEIFDINGKKVLHQELSDNKQISVSHLNRGLYMYKLIHNSTIYSGKIMIE